MGRLVFLKLGGSLITDKTSPYTPRLEKMTGLAGQIAAACREDADLKVLLGHGSGSFGHTAASEHGTRLGVRSTEQWQGFAEVGYQASALNNLLREVLRLAGLSAITFSPSSSVTTNGGKITAWDVRPIQAALAAGLLPVIYGDIVFDTQLGGTILSTEDLFEHLAGLLHPQRILLAGLEKGIWADFPARERLLDLITPADAVWLSPHLGGSGSADVTGGMFSKVNQMLRLVQRFPEMEVVIFSGEEPGSIGRILKGERFGTVVRNEN